VTRWIGFGVEVLTWWSLLVGVWVLTLSSVATSEMLAATGSALPCAVAATAAREVTGGHWRPSPAWIRWFVRLPVAVVADTGRLLVAAARNVAAGDRDRDPGELRTIPIAGGGPDDAYAARQALATFAVSFTPGTFVADVDPDHAVLLVHVLASGRPSMAEAVRR
jgi:multisubunit Na+/H+ antiporter MnhE subunit